MIELQKELLYYYLLAYQKIHSSMTTLKITELIQVIAVSSLQVIF